MDSYDTSQIQGIPHQRAIERVSAPQALFSDQLQGYYERGMNNYSSPEAKSLLQEAVAQTEIPEAHIKRWIDKVRRRARHIAKPAAPKVKTQKRHTRGVDLFYTEKLPKFEGTNNAERMKWVAGAWRELSEEEKSIYNDMAKCCPSPPTTATMDSKQKKKKAKEILRNMEKESWMLSELGYKGVLLLTVSDEGNFQANGSPRCLDWIAEQMETQYLFIATCMTEGPVVRQDPCFEDRKQVQEVFNKKFSEATGSKGKCSYKAMDEGRLKAVGLPNDIPFKRPSAYGASDLQTIIRCQQDISFVMIECRHAASTSDRGNEQVVNAPAKPKRQRKRKQSSSATVTQRTLTAISQNQDNATGTHPSDTEAVNIDQPGNPETRDLEEEVPILEDPTREDGMLIPEDISDSQSVLTADLPQGIYKVETVIKAKTVRKKKMCLVKWKGYDEPTWEPVENLNASVREHYS